MRVAILADIHSNLEAFQAVLRDMEARGEVDEIWCLGDVVGYGPDPHECLSLLRQYPHVSVAGNHDWAAIGRIDTSDFNPAAAAAARWTGIHLDEEDIHYLEGLPLILVRDDFTLVHGSPREPIWEYLLDPDSAQANLAYFQTPYCLVGHSHIPLLFDLQDHQCQVKALAESVALGEHRLIVNPGGVGQPRDGDPQASYAIYDIQARAIFHYRVPYDFAQTQQKMLEQGLTPSLAYRLSYGW